MVDYSSFFNGSVNTSVSYEKTTTTKSSNKELSSDNFKSVLNSSVKRSENSSNNEVRNNTKEKISNDNSKNDDLKEKINSLKEKIDKLSNSKNDENVEEDPTNEVKDILNEILSILKNLLNSTNEQKVNTEENSNVLLQNLVEEISQSSGEVNNDLQAILELLKESSSTENIDSDILDSFKEVLLSLSENTDESTEVQKGLKQDIDSIVSKLNEKLNQGKTSVTASEKTNKNSENSFGNSNEESNSMMSDSEVSKEDKFLSSLLDDDSNSFDNKIGIFSNRVQVNNSVNTTETRGLSINEATFADDLIQDVKYMTSNNLKELVVKVNPGNLGQITIELVQEDGVMKANLKANSKETTALLSQNIAEIQKELTDKNIKISEVNIELYNDDTTYFSGNFDGEFNKEQKQNDSESNNKINGSVSFSEEQEEENDNIALRESNLDFLA